MALIGYDVETWSRLPEFSTVQTKSKALDLGTDFKRLKGNCNAPKQVKLTFNGLGPSILDCSSGSVLVTLTKPTTLLLMPDGKKQ